MNQPKKFGDNTALLYQPNDTWSTPMHPRMPWLIATKKSTPMVLCTSAWGRRRQEQEQEHEREVKESLFII